jgi:hypothetical protein
MAEISLHRVTGTIFVKRALTKMAKSFFFRSCPSFFGFDACDGSLDRASEETVTTESFRM